MNNNLLEYTDNTSYREVIRVIIGMPNPKYIHQSNDEYLDEETGDEEYYDDKYMSDFLDSVYADTKDHPLFKKIYELAAAKMLSLNPEIGLAVLMSYDYLRYFYNCVLDFRSSPNTFNEFTESFILMHEKIA